MSWTSNNLYNKYYSKYIEQKGSILKGTFKLTIEEFNYINNRNKVFINGKYYKIINTIHDFDPMLKEQSFELELIETNPY